MKEAAFYMLQLVGIIIGIGVAFILVALVGRIFWDKNPRFRQWVKDIKPNEKQKNLLWTVIPFAFILWVIFR